jgi:hypothetical protein
MMELGRMTIPQKRPGFDVLIGISCLLMAGFSEWVTVTAPHAGAVVFFAAFASWFALRGLWRLSQAMKTSPDDERPAWRFGMGHVVLAMTVFAGSLGMRAAFGG